MPAWNKSMELKQQRRNHRWTIPPGEFGLRDKLHNFCGTTRRTGADWGNGSECAARECRWLIDWEWFHSGAREPRKQSITEWLARAPRPDSDGPTGKIDFCLSVVRVIGAYFGPQESQVRVADCDWKPLIFFAELIHASRCRRLHRICEFVWKASDLKTQIFIQL